MSALVPWGWEAQILSHYPRTGPLPYPDSPYHIAFMLHLYSLGSPYLSLEEEDSFGRLCPMDALGLRFRIMTVL